MYGILGALKPPASSYTASASSYTARCFELHSKKARAPFRSLKSNSHTSVLAVQVRHLISASLFDMLMIVVMLMFLHGAVAPFKRPYGYEAGYSVSSFSGPDSCSTLTILTQSPCHDMCTHGHSARGSATCASIISPPSMLKRKELFRAIGEATIW